MELKDRIRAWRDAIGATQKDFSELTGIPLRTLKGYEAGERTPGAEALAGIAKTGADMTWLLTGAGEMKQEGEGPPPESPRARRWEALQQVVEGIDDEEKRSAVLEELFARAQDAAEIAALRKEVERLSEERRKAG